jgi:glucose-1-phosphate cytidylyltransferase
MKVVILAGGLGTRLVEETETKPKPMVEVGNNPLIWHIMKHFAHYEHSDFVVALGHKGEAIKRFFVDRVTLAGNMTISMGDAHVHTEHDQRENWTVELVDTGVNTATGGRIKRLASNLDGRFFLTYGDGVSNLDLDGLLSFHKSHGRLATVTAVRPPSRFGGIRFRDDGRIEFTEKPQMAEGWISGGFFVLEPEVIDAITGDESSFEADVLEALAEDDQLRAFKHADFWQCVDTMRDLRFLQSLWDQGDPPWITWE